MARQLLVEGTKTFRITIPDDAKVTFGPFSPPTEKNFRSPEQLKGTLRVYEGGKTKTSESVLAVFTDVRSFRDLSVIDYEEQVIVEKGSTVWESDKDGYKREERLRRSSKFIDAQQLLESGDEDLET